MADDLSFDLGAFEGNPELADKEVVAPKPEQETSWTDYPKEVAAGLFDVGAGVASSAQAAGGSEEGLASAFRRSLGWIAEDIRGTQTPEFRRVQSLPFVADPGQPTVFDEGLSGIAAAGGAKLAGSVGSFLTFIGASLAAGPVGATTTGAQLSTGSALKDIYAESDKIPDDKLAEIPLVKSLLDDGYSIRDARAEWNRIRIGAIPLMNAVVGAAAARVGVGGALTRGTTQGAGRGASALRIGAQEAATEAPEGYLEEVTKQWAAIRGGTQEKFDASKLLNAPIEGGLIGFVMGAGTGAATGGAKAPTQKPVQDTPETGGLDITSALEASGIQPLAPAAPAAATAPAANMPNEAELAALNAAAPAAPAAAPAAPIAPAPAPAPAPAAPIAPVASTPQVTQPETPTVLETPPSLEAQVTDLQDGVRNVVLFPTGTKMADRPAMPEGMKSATIKGQGVVFYNPASGLVGKDFQTMNEATLSKLLNMSGTTKEDVLAAVGRGAQPAVVTVRNEAGVPVVDAATSSETAATDVPAIAAKARPTDTVEVRAPQDVVAERQAGQAASRFPVKPGEGVSTKGTAGRFITPQMRRDYAREMTKVDAQGRRLLPDMSNEAIRAFYEARVADRRNAETVAASERARATRAAQQELDAQKQEAAETETPKAPIVAAPKKKGKAYQASVDNAQKVIETNQPSDVEKAGFSSGAKAEDRVKARAALVKRLDTIISQARAQKVKIPTRWKDGTPDYLGWLRTVLDAKNGIEGGKDVSAIVQRYVSDEYAVSQGDFETVKKRRRGETKGKFGQGEVRESQQQEEVSDMSVDVEPTGRVREATVEEEANPTEVYGQTALIEEQEAPNQPVVEVSSKKKPLIDAPEVEVAKTTATVRTAGEELRARAPKVEGKISLKPRAKILPLEVQAREDQEQARSPAASLDDIAAAFTIRSATVSDIMRMVKISDLADVVRDNKLFTKLDQRLQRALAPQMMRALRKSVPDVKVNVLSDEGYALIAPPRTLGFYNPETDTITLTEAAFNDPKVLAWVIAHESAHAAFSKAIAQNRAIRSQLLTLMTHVKAKLAFNPMLRGEFRQNAPIEYGFKNVDEFIAEAWSNPAFQRLLASTEIPASMAEAVGIRPADRSRIRSVWDWLRFKVASILDLPLQGASALDAVLRISEDLQALSAQARATATKEPVGPSFLELPAVAQKTAEDLSVNIGGKLRRLKDRLKTTSMIARDMGDGLWKGTDAPIRAVQLRRAIDTKQSEILSRVGGEELINDHAILQRKNPELYARMADLGYGYTVYDINPGGADANPQIGKNKRKYWQSVEKMAELDAEFARIATIDPTYTKLMVRTSSTFKSIQNEVALKEIQNILDKVGVNEPGLAERIHTDGLTEADTAKFATNAAVNALNDARAFKKISGLYLPEMRRGEFIVNGRIDMEKYVPKTATQTDQDTMVFTGNGNFAQAERDVKAFLKGLDLTLSSVREIYVDKNDPQTQLEKDDVDSVPALRVRMQTQFTSFVETEAEANALAANMKSDGALDVKYQIKREALGGGSTVLSSDMKRIEGAMKRSENFKNLTTGERNTTLQAVRELALRLDGDGRLGHRRMYRRNVEGFSKDLLANTQQYLGQSAGYLARLEYQPKVDAAIKDMDAYMTARKDVSLADAAKMREQYNTLVERIEHTELPQSGAANSFTRRLLQISLLNKLASPAYHVINAHEPWTIAAPYMVGRHSITDVIASMGGAYKRLGVGGALGKGIIDTARAFGQDGKFTNFQDYFLGRMKAAGLSGDAFTRTKDMFDHLHTTGLFDREAGMEVTRLNDPSSNIAGRGLDKAEVVFRQMAVTMEAINRSVVSLAAYELEFKRTGNHEAAKNYAYETIHDTMGDYSATNASPIFNSQLGRLALQFKKYAQKTYWLLGRTIAHAFKGDREAMRQFAGLMFTTGLVTGVLGLPLEPIKIALLASGALLGTGFSYDDFEDLIRRTAAGIFGVKGGEVFSRGIYRTINVEVANRMGMDSLLTFGQPRGPTQQDLKSWLFDTAGGAPVGTVMNQIASINSLVNLEYLKALEQSMAPKLVTDLTKAYRGLTIGKESASGRQTLAPYTPTEAAMKAIGFTPAREFEQGRLRSQVFEQTRQQQTERTKFNQQWFKAGPAERAKLWGQIEKWNAGRPKDAQLTRSALDRYVKTRNTQESSGKVVDGITVNKANQYIYDQASGTYNTR